MCHALQLENMIFIPNSMKYATIVEIRHVATEMQPTLSLLLLPNVVSR